MQKKQPISICTANSEGMTSDDTEGEGKLIFCIVIGLFLFVLFLVNQ